MNSTRILLLVLLITVQVDPVFSGEMVDDDKKREKHPTADILNYPVLTLFS
jgi:hypothetical protein